MNNNWLELIWFLLIHCCKTTEFTFPSESWTKKSQMISCKYSLKKKKKRTENWHRYIFHKIIWAIPAFFLQGPWYGSFYRQCHVNVTFILFLLFFASLKRKRNLDHTPKPGSPNCCPTCPGDQEVKPLNAVTVTFSSYSSSQPWLQPSASFT